MVHIVAPSSVPLGSHARLRARVLAGGDCGPYAVCRSQPAEATVVWTMVSHRRPGLRFRHRSVVEDGRASWRTPRLRVRGRWWIKASYSGTDDQPAADDRTEIRITRP